jgi:hypothetical protein
MDVIIAGKDANEQQIKRTEGLNRHEELPLECRKFCKKEKTMACGY